MGFFRLELTQRQYNFPLIGCSEKGPQVISHFNLGFFVSEILYSKVLYIFDMETLIKNKVKKFYFTPSWSKVKLYSGEYKFSRFGESFMDLVPNKKSEAYMDMFSVEDFARGTGGVTFEKLYDIFKVACTYGSCFEEGLVELRNSTCSSDRRLVDYWERGMRTSCPNSWRVKFMPNSLFTGLTIKSSPLSMVEAYYSAVEAESVHVDTTGIEAPKIILAWGRNRVDLDLPVLRGVSDAAHKVARDKISEAIENVEELSLFPKTVNFSVWLEGNDDIVSDFVEDGCSYLQERLS